MAQHVKEALKNILEAFESGNIPEAIALIVKRPGYLPWFAP